MAKNKDDIAYLGANTVYNGQLSFSGEVTIDGKFTGEILSEGTLVIGKDAVVEGSVNVRELILSGKLHGSIVVTGKTLMYKTANLTGDLATRALIMEEGAMLQGSISMDPVMNAAAATSSIKETEVESGLREVDLQ